ncbi:velvet factor, partial [Phlyctochytrium arcticum]
LVVRQHPVRARMIGFGEKDRRPIAPPPILQIHLKDASGSPIPISHTASTTLIVHAQIYSESGDQDCNLVVNPFIQPSKTAPSPDPATLSKTLVGSLVSFCQPLTNEKGETGMYFAFPDLSVRVSGRFRLRFDVFDTANPLSLNGVPAKGTILSDPFTVYHPKEFPGMTGSTSLSRCFAAQGVRIHIRGGE